MESFPLLVVTLGPHQTCSSKPAQPHPSIRSRQCRPPCPPCAAASAVRCPVGVLLLTQPSPPVGSEELSTVHPRLQHTEAPLRLPASQACAPSSQPTTWHIAEVFPLPGAPFLCPAPQEAQPGPLNPQILSHLKTAQCYLGIRARSHRSRLLRPLMLLRVMEEG